jgi:hypothetical protein
MKVRILCVKVYNEGNNEYIGEICAQEPVEKADIILKHYEATLLGVINPICEEFLEEMQDLAFEYFDTYLENNPCDMTIKIEDWGVLNV